MTDTVRFEIREGVGLLTLNRPRQLNALNRALVGGIGAVLQDPALADCRALILTGEGNRAFAAGADIAEMSDLSATEAADFAATGQEILLGLETLPIPTIAAVRGFALGGGCELAMCCDFILATPNAVFGQPEVKLGVIPGFGGTQRLIRRVGRQRALELMMTGRYIQSDEALALGLVLGLHDDPVEAAFALVARIAANGPVAVALVKQAVHRTDRLSILDGLAVEAELFGECFATADQKEGMAAFLGKRTPKFTGT
jgi:enoyl-CoA hydratase